jgi:arsenite methyltransferase
MGKLPDYGIDAPTIVRNNAVGGILAWIASAALFIIFRRSNSDFAQSILVNGFILGTLLLAVAAFMFWSSKVGKFWIRDKLLSLISWRGDEQVLDIGCGRGLALIGAAHRLTTGHATGIDLWSAKDLSNNSTQAVTENAKTEKVAAKITIKTGDARALPFPDDSFDVVVSMTAIHNINGRAERRRAIEEAVRVLKANGTLAIFDIFYAGTYVRWLRELGMKDVSRSRVILLWMIPGRLIKARKGA